MKFKYKFSTAIYVLFAIMYLLAVVCFVWNLIRLCNSLTSSIALDTYDVISCVLCLALPIVLSIFITAMIISSRYIIEEKKIIVKFGFIGDTYKISDLSSVIKNVKTQTLHLVFNDESTLKITIDSSSFDDFSAYLMQKNKNISYGETDEDNKKK